MKEKLFHVLDCVKDFPVILSFSGKNLDFSQVWAFEVVSSPP